MPRRSRRRSTRTLVISATTSIAVASRLLSGLNKVMSPVAAGTATAGQAERLTMTPVLGDLAFGAAAGDGEGNQRGEGRLELGHENGTSRSWKEGARIIGTARGCRSKRSRWTRRPSRRAGHGDSPPSTLLIAAPRGFCAGVDRAIRIVELALERYGAPVYVRHEIVHNRFVVDSLKAKGAIFVAELDEVPDGVPVVFSAHGVPKAVPAEARRSAASTISTPPARSSPRSTARPSGWSSAAATSCSSAMPAIPR